MIITYKNFDITDYFLDSDIVEISDFDDKITIKDDYDNITEYDNKLYVKLVKDENGKFKNKDLSYYNKLKEIHKNLIFDGNLNEEFPEQLMSCMFIEPNNKVLELGANIGRNTCLIAKLLNDSKNLVTFEPHIETADHLKRNRDANNLQFNIEVSTISKLPLAQCYWDTKPCFQDEPGWTRIKTLSWDEVKKKYNNIEFDTLVLDCEGHIFNIIYEEPDFLNNFKTIIIENDFKCLYHKIFFNNSLKKFNFKNIYRERGPFKICSYNSYEVWRKS
jgi:FkbM family methyltransferase